MDVFNNPLFIVGMFVAALAVGAFLRLKVFNGDKQARERTESSEFRVQSALVATLVAVVAVLFQLPSLSIDINGIFTYAFDVVNAFMPLIAIIAGLGLGFSLIGKISSLFTRAF